VLLRSSEALYADLRAEIAREVVAEIRQALNSALAHLEGGKATNRGTRRGSSSALRAPRKVTSWVADRAAKRVPNFVIDLTGLKTKRDIVEKYGDGAAFEVGQPLPPPTDNAGEPSPGRRRRAAGAE